MPGAGPVDLVTSCIGRSRQFDVEGRLITREQVAQWFMIQWISYGQISFLYHPVLFGHQTAQESVILIVA